MSGAVRQLAVVLLGLTTSIGVPVSSTSSAMMPTSSALGQATIAGGPAAAGRNRAAASIVGLLDGTDACALVLPADVAEVTGRAVIDQEPGLPGGRAGTAGCLWRVDSGQEDLPGEVVLTVRSPGGRAEFEGYLDFFTDTPRVEGIGDAAYYEAGFNGLTVLQGDTSIFVQYIDLLNPDAELVPEALMRLILGRASADDALVSALQGQPFGATNVDAAIAALAASGIEVYEEGGDDDPLVPVTGEPSPIAFTRAQVRNLALELSGGYGGGTLGDDIASIAAMPTGSPPFPYLLAAWVVDGGSDGARLAASLLGDQDWTHPGRAIFPGLVLALFVADVTAAVSAGDPATPSGSEMAPRSAPAPRMLAARAPAGDRRGGRSAGEETVTVLAAAQPAAGGGLCSAVAGFVQNALNYVFDSLKLGETGSSFINFFVRIWNGALALARGVVDALLTVLTADVVTAIKAAVGILGTFAMISGYLRQWSVRLDATPSSNAFGVGFGQPGTVTAHLSRGGEASEWPAALVDCARVVGATLPSLAARDVPIAWTTSNDERVDLTFPDPGDPRFGAGDVAMLRYVTGTESADASRGTPELGRYLRVTVRVERPEVAELRKVLGALLYGAIPNEPTGILKSLVHTYLDPIEAKLLQVADVRGSAAVEVVFHRMPEPTPPVGPRPPVGPKGLRGPVWVSLSREAGYGLPGGTFLILTSCDGPYGTWRGDLIVGGMLGEDGKTVVIPAFMQLEFTVGGSGVRTVRTSGDAAAWFVQFARFVPIHHDLLITVDGTSMAIAVEPIPPGGSQYVTPIEPWGGSDCP